MIKIKRDWKITKGERNKKTLRDKKAERLKNDQPERERRKRSTGEDREAEMS